MFWINGTPLYCRARVGTNSVMPNPPMIALPDFRNLGVMLRIALIAESMRLIAAYSAAPDLAGAFADFTTRGVLYEPALLSIVIVLFVASPILANLPYRRGVAAVIAIASAIAAAWHLAFYALLPELALGSVFRTAFLSTVVAAAILGYFNWRHRVLTPALAESRLMALQARIRPHFLFNSLNSVLGLIRDDPKRAESMLENLADLYRALMSEPRALVPLSQEIELARAYAEIEAIRLGPRLKVRWQCDQAPLDALLPPLILQPLVENAIYHGVEPAETGAEIAVNASEDDGNLTLIVRNPCHSGQSARAGNRLALNNIRERLALHFDAEAEMTTSHADGEFVVRIRLPYKREHAA